MIFAFLGVLWGIVDFSPCSGRAPGYTAWPHCENQDEEIGLRFFRVPPGFPAGVRIHILSGRRFFMEDGCTILAKKECVPCKGGVPPLKGAELEALKKQLGHGWTVVDEHHLEKEFPFPDFATALAFTNRVGEIAEREGHHPDIHLAYGKAVVTVWTHKIDGLTESDIVFAVGCSESSRRSNTWTGRYPFQLNKADGSIVFMPDSGRGMVTARLGSAAELELEFSTPDHNGREKMRQTLLDRKGPQMTD
jgi:4a-hydroxytetrahydrobiopterin dehydratase